MKNITNDIKKRAHNDKSKRNNRTDMLNNNNADEKFLTLGQLITLQPSSELSMPTVSSSHAVDNNATELIYPARR